MYDVQICCSVNYAVTLSGVDYGRLENQELALESVFASVVADPEFDQSSVSASFLQYGPSVDVIWTVADLRAYPAMQTDAFSENLEASLNDFLASCNCYIINRG